jgi:hypothetical protein
MHSALSVKERLHNTLKLLAGGGFPALLEMGIFCVGTKIKIRMSGLTECSELNPSIIRHSGI